MDRFHLPADFYETIMETLEILDDPELMASPRAGAKRTGRFTERAGKHLPETGKRFMMMVPPHLSWAVVAGGSPVF